MVGLVRFRTGVRVTVVQRWTGRETRALRQSLRLSVRAFAEDLGVSPRTVSKWEAAGAGREPRPELQAALDTLLRRCDDEVCGRFQAAATGADPGDGPARWEAGMLSPNDIDLDTITPITQRTCAPTLNWHVDTLANLAELGRDDVDVDRRRVLEVAAYSAAALALPAESWWHQMAAHRRPTVGRGLVFVGLSDVDAVRDMTALFSRVDQRRGGGHARAAVIRYLTVDVATYLRSNFIHDDVRRAMFAAASELAYLVGWMAFDDLQHAQAQRYFSVALKLAAEADDPPLAGHILRAMAHQAIDLKRTGEALDLSTASTRSDRYSRSSPRERALVSVIHARSLAVNGNQAAATAELLRAEDALASATDTESEPGRVFFFGEASLAHETACALRDSGDLDTATAQFERSITTRKASKFTRTHAVTLGYMGAVQIRQGKLEQACHSWTAALDAMEGVRSGRAREVVTGMRQELGPLQQGAPEITQLLRRANTYLATSA